jgi:hypothetical protein
MTTIVSELYDALRDAQGVSDEKARKAVGPLAQMDDSKALADGFRGWTWKLERTQGDISLPKWMEGAVFPLLILILLKLFIH